MKIKKSNSMSKILKYLNAYDTVCLFFYSFLVGSYIASCRVKTNVFKVDRVDRQSLQFDSVDKVDTVERLTGLKSSTGSTLSTFAKFKRPRALTRVTQP